MLSPCIPLVKQKIFAHISLVRGWTGPVSRMGASALMRPWWRDVMFQQRSEVLTCIMVVTAALLVAIAKCGRCSSWPD